MRNTFYSALLAGLMLPMAAQAQTPAQNIDIDVDTAGDINITWDGITNRTYFMQWSTDLVNWTYFPTIESGAGNPMSYGFNSTSSEFFVRLKYQDGEVYDVNNADFDNDGSPNSVELLNGTDPFNPDSDGDGTPDGPDPDPLDSSVSTWLSSTITLETRGETLRAPITDSGTIGTNIYGQYSSSWVNPNINSVDPDVIYVTEGGIASSWQYVESWNPNVPNEASSVLSGPPMDENSFPTAGENESPAAHGWNLFYGAGEWIGGGSVPDTSGIAAYLWQDSYLGLHYQGWSRQQIRLTADIPVQYDTSRTFLKVRKSLSYNTNYSGNEPVDTIGTQAEVLGHVTLTIPAGEMVSEPYTLEYPSGDGVNVDVQTVQDEYNHNRKSVIDKHLQIQVLSHKINIDAQGKEVAGELVEMNSIKVSKMELALTLNKTGGIIIDEDLNIDNDLDRFYIRIPNGALDFQGKQVAIYLKTSNPDAEYNDDETRIDLTIDGDNLITPSLILTSNDIDDDFTGDVDIGADDVLNDRTHKIIVGGKLMVSKLLVKSGDSETEYLLDHELPHSKNKSVTLNFVILNDGNVNEQQAQTILERDFKVAKERYAQVGIEILKGTVEIKPLPEGLLLPDGELRVNLTTDVQKLHSDVKAIISAYGTDDKNDDIHVFYSPIDIVGGPNNASLEGVGLNKFFNNPEDVGYLSNVFIKQSNWSTALSHEVAHVLTNDGHIDQLDYMNHPQMVEYGSILGTNIMKSPYTTDDVIGASRRFFRSQEKLMMKWPYKYEQ